MNKLTKYDYQLQYNSHKSSKEESMIENVKQSFIKEIRQVARENVIKKLQKAGVEYTKLSIEEFESLIDAEIDILKSDTKKVGIGIGIGIAISLLTGI